MKVSGRPRSRARELGAVRITDAEFGCFKQLIHRVAGIHLSANKRELVCSRLAKRLRHLELSSFREYYEHLRTRDPEQTELWHMINCITTNETHFFREPHHFEFLAKHVFPELEREQHAARERRLRIWSAGCSTGEEPYSIAITVAEHLKSLPLWSVKILASDIDTEVLARAEAGVYAPERAAELPPSVRQRWFELDDEREGCSRAKSSLRELLRFRRINLIDESWPIKTHFDVIFCRNVTIYFDRATQERLYERFARLLRPGGYLIAGHSENLTWLRRLFVPIGKTVYRLNPDFKSEPRPNGSNPVRTRSKSPRARAPTVPPKTAGASQRVRVKETNIVSGKIFASREPAAVRTLLGSCVSVCLHDPVAQVGGMNHFMLPNRARDRIETAAYGVHAMELLINEIMALGGDRRRLTARVFGGARVLRQSMDIGRANARFALDFLEREGIPVLERRLGGELPLKIRYLTHTGEASVQAVGSERETVVAREAEREIEVNRELEASSEPRIVLF